MAVALLTAIYGGYDTLKPLPANHGFDDAVCVTDNPNLLADGWRIEYVPRENMAPRLASKYPKMQPFDFVDADTVVWLDAAFHVTHEGFKDFCLNALGDNHFVVWSHPDRAHRNCLFDEATLCQDWVKYRDYPIREQVEHYEAEGMPRGFGLWACGTIVWRNSVEAIEFGRLWLQENVKWSIQDQISFPYLLWKYPLMFAEFPDHEYDNPYLDWHKHLSEN